jgi:hypothetical protein
LEAEDTYYDRAVYNRLAILLKMMALARFGRMRYLRLKSARLCLVLSLCNMILIAKSHGLDSRASIILGHWKVIPHATPHVATLDYLKRQRPPKSCMYVTSPAGWWWQSGEWLLVRLQPGIIAYRSSARLSHSYQICG